MFDQSNVIKLDGKMKKKRRGTSHAFNSVHAAFQKSNLTYVIVSGLLQIFDGYDLLSFLLGRFALFGSLVLSLGSELVLRWFRLPLSLCGRRRSGHSHRHPGLVVGLLFGSGRPKQAAPVCSRRGLLRLWLGWFLTLLTGGFVEGALMTGWCRLVTGRAHRLVFGGRMRNGEGRIVKTPSRHQALGLAGETQPFLFLQHRHENTLCDFLQRKHCLFLLKHHTACTSAVF